MQINNLHKLHHGYHNIDLLPISPFLVPRSRNKENLQNIFTPNKHTGIDQTEPTDDIIRNFDGHKPLCFNLFIVN